MCGIFTLPVVPEAERSEAVRNPYPRTVIMDSGLAGFARDPE